MRIAYFFQHFSTPAGSTWIRPYVFARWLVERGHDVTVICGSYRSGVSGQDGPFIGGRREGMVDGIRVVEFDLSYANQRGLVRRTWIFFRYAFAAIPEACRRRYDLIFSSTPPLTAGLPGIVARVLTGKPFV